MKDFNNRLGKNVKTRNGAGYDGCWIDNQLYCLEVLLAEKHGLNKHLSSAYLVYFDLKLQVDNITENPSNDFFGAGRRQSFRSLVSKVGILPYRLKKSQERLAFGDDLILKLNKERVKYRKSLLTFLTLINPLKRRRMKDNFKFSCNLMIEMAFGGRLEKLRPDGINFYNQLNKFRLIN